MPWLKTLLLDHAPVIPATEDLTLHSVALSGHVLYWERSTRQYWILHPEQPHMEPWTRYDGTGPRQAPIGHWVPAR